MIKKSFILASKSPFRAKLLQAAGLCFEQVASQVDESEIKDDSPLLCAEKRAFAKAEKIAKSKSECLVVGCDQTLDLENKLLQKPKNEEEAFKQIKNLQSKIHFLHSSVAFSYWKEGQQENLVKEHCFTRSQKLKMRSLTDSEIENYIATQEWQGCVGGYRMESQGINLFEELKGFPHDSSTIIGLPLLPFLERLRVIEC